jgi:lipopolysaccharide export LptBFGC system permease protein LptF
MVARNKSGRDICMNRFRLVIPFLVLASLLAGCATGDFDQAAPYKQETANGYCHMILQPVGPTDLIRPTQSRSGDYINYFGPCDGPSAEEQARKQRRFEQFRFGRDYMPG